MDIDDILAEFASDTGGSGIDQELVDDILAELSDLGFSDDEIAEVKKKNPFSFSHQASKLLSATTVERELEDILRNDSSDEEELSMDEEEQVLEVDRILDEELNEKPEIEEEPGTDPKSDNGEPKLPQQHTLFKQPSSTLFRGNKMMQPIEEGNRLGSRLELKDQMHSSALTRDFKETNLRSSASSDVSGFQVDDLAQRMKGKFGNYGNPSSIAICKKYIVIGSETGYILFFDHLKDHVKTYEPRENSPITALDIDQNGVYMVAGSAVGTMFLWNVSHTKLISIVDATPDCKSPVISLNLWSDLNPHFVSMTLDGDLLLTQFHKFFSWSHESKRLTPKSMKITAMDVLPQSAYPYLRKTKDPRDMIHPLIALCDHAGTYVMPLDDLQAEENRVIRNKPLVDENACFPSVAWCWANLKDDEIIHESRSNTETDVTTLNMNGLIDNNNNNNNNMSNNNKKKNNKRGSRKTKERLRPCLARGWGTCLEIMTLKGDALLPTKDNFVQAKKFLCSHVVQSVFWLGSKTLVYANANQQLVAIDVSSDTELTVLELDPSRCCIPRPFLAKNKLFEDSLYSVDSGEIVKVQRLKLRDLGKQVQALVAVGSWIKALSHLANHHVVGERIPAADRIQLITNYAQLSLSRPNNDPQSVKVTCANIVDFCLTINDVNLLFKTCYAEILSTDEAHKSAFLRVLYKAVSLGLVRSIETLPLKHLVELLLKSGDHEELAQLLTWIDRSKLDINHTVKLCKEYYAIKAMAFIYGRDMNDYLSTLQYFLNSFRFAETDSLRQKLFHDILQYSYSCLLGKVYSADIPSDDLPRVRAEILQHLFTFEKKDRKKKGGFVSFHNLQCLLEASTQHTLELLFLAYTSDAVFGQDFPAPTSGGEWQEYMVKSAKHVQVSCDVEHGVCPSRQSMFDAVACIILGAKRNESRFTDYHYADFYDWTAKVAAEELVQVRGIVLRNCLRQLAEPIGSRMKSSHEREALIIRIINILPRGSFKPRTLLSYVDRVSMKRAALLIHRQYSDFGTALEAHLRPWVDEDDENIVDGIDTKNTNSIYHNMAANRMQNSPSKGSPSRRKSLAKKLMSPLKPGQHPLSVEAQQGHCCSETEHTQRCQIFDVIISTFDKLNEKRKERGDKDIIKMRQQVIDRVSDLKELNLQRTIDVLVHLFPATEIGQDANWALEQLQDYPRLQFDYLKEIMSVPMNSKKVIDKQSNTAALRKQQQQQQGREDSKNLTHLLTLEKNEVSKTMQLTYIRLLCQFEREHVSAYLKGIDNFPLYETLQLAEQYSITEAQVVVHEKLGQYNEALELYITPLQEALNVVLYDDSYGVVGSSPEFEVQLRLGDGVQLCMRHSGDGRYDEIGDISAPNSGVLKTSNKAVGLWRRLLGSLVQWQLEYRSKNNGQGASILSDSIDTVLMTMSRHIDVSTIMDQLIERHNNTPFGDFKHAMREITDVQSGLESMLKVGSKLLDVDVFKRVNELHRGRAQGLKSKPDATTCDTCHQLLRTSNMLVVGSCGHCYHFREECFQDYCKICDERKRKRPDFVAFLDDEEIIADEPNKPSNFRHSVNMKHSHHQDLKEYTRRLWNLHERVAQDLNLGMLEQLSFDDVEVSAASLKGRNQRVLVLAPQYAPTLDMMEDDEDNKILPRAEPGTIKDDPEVIAAMQQSSRRRSVVPISAKENHFASSSVSPSGDIIEEDGGDQEYMNDSDEDDNEGESGGDFDFDDDDDESLDLDSSDEDEEGDYSDGDGDYGYSEDDAISEVGEVV